MSASVCAARKRWDYGLDYAKQNEKNYWIESNELHLPMSLGVSEVSERANEWAQLSVQAKQAVQSKQMSEW